MTHFVIGIDIGTTNTKAVAFAMSGEVLASAGTSYSAFTDAGGRHELDPHQLTEAVATTLAIVMQRTGKAPAGISFSCAFHSLLAVDGNGKPMMRVMTWADLRPAHEARELKSSEAGHRIYERTGTPIHAMSPLCKLLWLRNADPLLFHSAARFIGIKEYIWWRIFGKYQIDHGMASATGLFDIRRLDWYPESLTLAGIGRERLSVPVPGTHIETARSSRFLELPAGIPFVIGGGDGCLANLGSGAARPGETALTIGTSGAIRMTAASPESDQNGSIFNYILTANRFTCGGATNNGGNALKWLFEKLLGIMNEADWDRMVRAAGEVPAGCDGLIFLPYLQGERAPVWDAEASGVFFGVRSIHDHRHFIRACMEGISYSLCEIGASLEGTLGPIDHIYATGGFTRSEIWLQMVADIFLKKVHLTGVTDASAVGAAMLGLQALGLIGDTDAAAGMVRVQRTYYPVEAQHVRYRRNYAIFSQLYSRLHDLK
ncbi:MAG TPA: gluconokinase [Puia sp.]|nr:gluconokinase [Puia sp.]